MINIININVGGESGGEVPEENKHITLSKTKRIVWAHIHS